MMNNRLTRLIKFNVNFEIPDIFRFLKILNISSIILYCTRHVNLGFEKRREKTSEVVLILSVNQEIVNICEAANLCNISVKKASTNCFLQIWPGASRMNTVMGPEE